MSASNAARLGFVLVMLALAIALRTRCPACRNWLTMVRTGNHNRSSGQFGRMVKEWSCRHCGHTEWKFGTRIVKEDKRRGGGCGGFGGCSGCGGGGGD